MVFFFNLCKVCCETFYILRFTLIVAKAYIFVSKVSQINVAISRIFDLWSIVISLRSAVCFEFKLLLWQFYFYANCLKISHNRFLKKTAYSKTNSQKCNGKFPVNNIDSLSKVLWLFRFASIKARYILSVIVRHI